MFVIIAFVILHFLHPGKLLPVSNKVYLALDGETEKLGPGWADKRHFLITLFDPFDLVGLIRKRDSKERFWENDDIAAQESTTLDPLDGQETVSPKP